MNDLLPAVLADAERERDVEAADAAAAGRARALPPHARGEGPAPAERFLEEASRASRAIDALRGGLARLRGLHAGCARRARRSLPRALPRADRTPVEGSPLLPASSEHDPFRIALLRNRTHASLNPPPLLRLRAQTAARPERVTRLRREMAAETTRLGAAALDAKHLVDALARGGDAFSRTDEAKAADEAAAARLSSAATPTERRFVATVSAGLRRKLADVSSAFVDLRVRIREAYVASVASRYAAVTGKNFFRETNPETLERVADDPGFGERTLREAIRLAVEGVSGGGDGARGEEGVVRGGGSKSFEVVRTFEAVAEGAERAERSEPAEAPTSGGTRTLEKTIPERILPERIGSASSATRIGSASSASRIGSASSASTAVSSASTAVSERGRRVSESLPSAAAERDAAAELEMGMHRLHQIFVDMSSMVERQGGVVESVEAHVARSAACVESGAAALDDARALRAKRRRRTMVAVAIAAGVLAVVAMLVLAGFARG